MSTDVSQIPTRPFYQLLGIIPISAADGRSVVVLADNPDLGNSRGGVHGGAIFTLLDVACARAARSALLDGAGAATINLTVTYLAPAHGRLTAYGLVLRAGQTIVAVEADAKDDKGQLVAKAFGTMRTIAARTTCS
jgi:uncharacterized protein (TIGR00369 family)